MGGRLARVGRLGEPEGLKSGEATMVKRLGALILSGCLVTSVTGDPHTPTLGELHACTRVLTCPGLGDTLFPRVKACGDDTDELQNRVAYKCWQDYGGCAEGFCTVWCEGLRVACPFYPEDL